MALHKLLNPLYGYPLAAWELLKALGASTRWLSLDHTPLQQVGIPADFIGVNVAPGDDPQINAYVLERLEQLGVQAVRMDFSYNSPGGATEALLETLLQRGYRVILDLFPPLEEAARLFADRAAQARWQEFLGATFDSYQGRVTHFEIGNTPNRGKWSGFSAYAFIAAWVIATEQARGRNLSLAGPNVSDFEPLYNSVFLGLLGRLRQRPDIHTDNLFVERVVEPEAFDHRVLGRWATRLCRVNLVKKARILQHIGAARHSGELVCTYTCWTSKRLARRSPWPADKGVDYMTRYLMLAAASGALRQVCWGPLICHRDGLIDDRCVEYPEIDQVSFYEKVRGQLEDFHITPGFYALGFAVQRMAGAQVTGFYHDPDGLSLARLCDREQRHFLLAWCRDGMGWSTRALFGGSGNSPLRCFNCQGEVVDYPVTITEHPLYLEFAQSPTLPDAASIERAEAREIVHLSSPALQTLAVSSHNWLGAVMLRTDQQAQDQALAEKLYPERLPGLEELEVLRDVRNRLWNVHDPRGLVDRVTVKLNRTVGFKRLSYRFRPSKGRRHWNNACQMLRRGVSTPTPIAFYEARERPGTSDSWYLCEFIPGAFSSREVYAAFREGAQEYRGLDKPAWFDLLSGFVCQMHQRQVVHRDLSAGNLLLRQGDTGGIEPMVIDIGRAWIWSGPGSRVTDRHRLLDLIRICYKLDWDDRKQFISRYEYHLGRSLTALWRLPFHYYDAKQSLKKSLKGKRRKRPRRL